MSVLAMDQVRIETRVDDAVARFGVTGKGVIVALMDRGIDWKNNDFRNTDGTTRIKYIFDLTDDTGASDPGNPYGFGTIYTESQINAALTGGPTLATRDAVGHGTTTSAIPAGNGRNSAALKYRGIATDATIISVKITSDGAPAHDGQPAEAAFYDPSRIPVAIDFIKDKAATLGMPCVMLLNLGSIGGATDGTSTLARKIDSVVGPGVHGLLFVTGPGDDGGTPNHAAATVPTGAAISTQLRKSTDSTQPLYFDMWYPGLDQSNVNANLLNITIQTPSGTFGPYLSPATNSDSDFQQTSDFTYYHLGGNVNFSAATSGKREVYIIFNGGVGTYTVTATASNSTSGGHFDATLNPSYIINGPDPSRFLTNVVAGSSIWDGASAIYNICPGDYVHRTGWTDIDGISRSFTSQGNIGEIWQGSAAGPTLDGRLGIDICAPGDSLFTTYNPTSYWATFRFNLIQDGGGLYGRASAVSAAAPIATGVLALMLQMDHYLDAPTAKQILQQTARSDSFTGAVPNSTWGYGKIDAYAALSLLELRIATLGNISTRLNVGTGDSVMIGGFIINGTQSKKVIVRAIGPSLSQFGITNSLQDPTLELHDGSGALIATNDNWQTTQIGGIITADQVSDIQNSGLAPTQAAESAIIATLQPGSYTAIVRGTNNTTGIALVESYDLDRTVDSKLANISTRGFVQIGDNVMIGGLIVQGIDPVKVIVRAIGPSLSQFGITNSLQDPTLELHDGSGALIATNDNWQTTQIGGIITADQVSDIQNSGLAPTQAAESAIIATLQPGSYTAIVRGTNNTTGIALVEAYQLGN